MHKMSDVFDLPVFAGTFGEPINSNMAAAHAVNCHDGLVAALLSANTYIHDEAERRKYDPPIPSALALMINSALRTAMGEEALRAHVDRQRSEQPETGEGS